MKLLTITAIAAAHSVGGLAGPPPSGLSGTDPTITIPTVRITLADGNTIKSALASANVMATLPLDLTVRAGADPANHALLFTAPRS